MDLSWIINHLGEERDRYFDAVIPPIVQSAIFAHPDIATWGRAATDGNFVGGSDAVTYAIDVQGRRLPLTVSAELLYQATSRAFVSDLSQDSGDLVQRFAGYYDRADKSPMLVSSVQVTVR